MLALLQRADKSEKWEVPILAEEKNDMSNPRAWRAKPRTPWPNSRQKRNGLFLDAHPFCQRCNSRRASEAHHELPHGPPDRYDWRFMKAMCVQCHIEVHQAGGAIVTVINVER